MQLNAPSRRWYPAHDRTEPSMNILFTLLFALGLSSSIAHAHELELLFYRAPKPLNWSTPGELVRSAYHNSFRMIGHWEGDQYRYDIYPHSISHVDVKLQCDDEAPIYTGMTSDRSDLNYAWDLMVRGRALETFLIDVKGRFYQEAEILKWLPLLKQQGYVRSLRIQINQEQCYRAKDYLRRYKDLQINTIYGGLRSDPLLGQGAGCAAFAVSFLQILNIFPIELAQYWQRTLKVPIRLLSSTSRKADIGFWGYLRGQNARWAKNNEPQTIISFWDPEMMYTWVGPKNITTWDVRQQPVPTSPYFKMSSLNIQKNQKHHSLRLNQLLSEAELRNGTWYECKRFGYCPNK